MIDTDETNEQLISAFFRERLLPIAKHAKERGVELFPLGPDAKCESYFIERKSGEDYVCSIDRNDLESELARLWSQEDIPELFNLARDVIELATRIRETEQEPDDISPFIYAMF